MAEYSPQELTEAYDVLFVHGRKSVFTIRETIAERRTILANTRAVLKSLTADQAEGLASDAVISIEHAKDELRALELTDLRTLLDAEDKLWQSLIAPFLERDKIRSRKSAAQISKQEAQKEKDKSAVARAETVIGLEEQLLTENTEHIAQILDNIADILAKESDYLKDSHITTLVKMRASRSHS